MRDHAKIQSREIAKKRLDPNFQRDQMQAISSSDYDNQNQPAKSLDELGLSGEGAKEESGGLKNFANAPAGGKQKNSFQQMLADSEMKGVAKKAPKKGMQLGKPKNKPNNAMIKELEKQQVITKQEIVNANEEEEKAPEYNALTENVQMEIDERITCQITKDGDIEKFEFKGIVYMTLTDVKKTSPEVLFGYDDFKGLVFKVHPELDK